jgi:anti-sigma28 factor (negative regulator of flagellin synthesis)
MATVAAISKLQPADHRKSQDARNSQGRHASPTSDVLILGNRNTTSHEEALKRIASLPPIRQGKVLDIRRRIAEGTYDVRYRLDKAMDRVLEAITT